MSAVVAGRPLRGMAMVVLTLISSACQGSPPAQPSSEPSPDAYESSFTGYVSKTYAADFDTGIAACKSALEKLGFNVTDESGALFEKAFEAKSEDGTTIVLTLSAVTKATTRIRIKVGYFFGNGDAALRIHSEIDSELTARRDEAQEKQRRWGRSLFEGPNSPSPSPIPKGAPQGAPTSDRR